MPTAPSPEAPTIVKAVPAPKLTIPTLSQLTGTAKPEPVAPAPGSPVAPVAPVPGQDLNSLLGKPPGAEPVVPVVPGEPGVDEPEGIDTSIVPPRPGAPPKSKADFAAERQRSKTKVIEEAERLRDEAVAEATKLRLEVENERKERVLEKKELEDFKALATTREKDVEELNQRYFDQFKPAYDAGTDQELVTAHTGMFKTLEDNMPAYIDTSEGPSKRVMFQQIVSNPQHASVIENAMLHYAAAKQSGDEEVMNAAVTTIHGVIANDTTVKFFGRGDQRNKLLSSDDPVFRQIETAMVRAWPHLETKANRAAFIQQNAPKLAEERIVTRTRAINSELSTAFSLAPDQIAATLQSDPTNSIAIFSAILNHAPHLKQQVDASIAKTSEALSSVPDQLVMPPLKSNDKESVARHRQLYQERRKELNELARFAIIGKNCGAIIADLIAARDDAEARAEAAAANTNPGASRPGSGTPPAVEKEIDTQIMPAMPG